ncbi:Methanogenesis regulatory histidine kinase FilI [uncultured archaeon]|nr:Methanogenesis regulatory histidine kinase FilI [uncultured archaeon]
MKAVDRTKEKLIRELRQRIDELEKSGNKRQREMEKLLMSENKYKVLIENLPQKIFYKDRNSVYVSCNESYANDLKIKPDEIVGKTDYNFYIRELAEKYRADDKRIMESGETEYIEEKYIQNGQEVFVQTAKTPLKDEKGNTIGILGIFWDITERRQIEEALKESEERYRTIIEFSNDMIWTLDTEGRFLFFNKRSEEITGYKLEDWQGKSFAPLIEKDDLTKVIEVFHKTLGGEPQQYEVSVKKEDGINIILLVNTAPIYSKGKVVGTVSFGQDITEHKKAEEQIKESLNQKLMKSNKQKKLLCYLIEGTRGGKTRALILRHLTEKSYNANQLAKALNMDYKTIRHHLKVLLKKGMITRGQDEYSGLYFIAKNIESDLEEMDIWTPAR